MTKDDQASSYIEHLSYLTENEPFNKYLLISQSSYLKTIIKARIKKKLNDKFEFENFTFFGDELDLENFSNLLDQNLFFSSGKFINVKRASLISKVNLGKIISLNLLTREFKDLYLIFEDDILIDGISKDFMKAFSSFKILSDDSMSNSQIASWVEARLRSLKLDFPKDIPKSIANLAGNNIDYAMQIADRLYLLSPQSISGWYNALNNFPKEQTAVIFSLSDALLGKKYDEALKIYSILLDEGSTVENILYFLINHYSFLCEVKLNSLTYKTKKDILSVMRDQNAFRVEKALQQIKKVSFKSINKALTSLIKIEKDFKSGRLINISDELLLFIGGSK